MPLSSSKISSYTNEYGDELVNDDIYSIHPDGSGRKSFKDANGVGVAFSPHGRLLAYARSYGYGVRLVRADGRGRDRRLTRGNDYSPAWAPGGRGIVFTRYSLDFVRSKLRIYQKGKTRSLTDGSDPAWSVEGWIAFDREDGIYVIRPDGTGLRHVLPDGSAPDWSPDGHRIVFSGTSESIFTVREDGSGLRRLRRGSQPAFSPNGHEIVYVSPGGLLMTMGAGGQHPRRVPHSRGGYGRDYILRPDWQPLAPFR
jgi:Tol biopolymer transport system component